MNTLPIRTDPRFDQHFRNLTQVFFYLTDECTCGVPSATTSLG